MTCCPARLPPSAKPGIRSRRNRSPPQRRLFPFQRRRGKDVLVHHRRIVAALAALAATAGATGVAFAAAAPSKVTVKESQTVKFVPNRYIQDGLRWDKDVYTVKSGGTVKVVANIVSEGPHTFSIVARKALPKTAKPVQNC